MRVSSLSAIPLSYYRRALRQKLGLRGKKLDAASRCAQRGGDKKAILHAAAYA